LADLRQQERFVNKSGETKLFIGILVVALVLVGFALKPMLFPSKDTPIEVDIKPGKIDKADLLPPGTRYRGNANAPYILVEFGDYQCPQCQTAAAEVDRIVKMHSKKLRCVFTYSSVVPVTEHPRSDVMALAAEAAGKQGKYWEMHRALFVEQFKFKDANQDQALAQINQTASQIGVDVVAMRADMASPEVGAALDRQKAIGAKAKLKVTPSFYLVGPGDVVEPIGNLDDMKKRLDKPEALK
jgi:protein-disulfide isomerase